MMAHDVKLACLECGAVNRVPAERIAAGPKCGVCGAKLMDGKVRELDPATLAKASRSDTIPLVVDFWTPWCGPCRMMAPEFAKAASALAGRARFAKIDTEAHPAVSRSHGIRGIPLLILFRGGKELARQTGAQRADAIERWVTMSMIEGM